MKILSIPTLVHDSSICILNNGEIELYEMEERFSRVKHDAKFDCILNRLIEKYKDDLFDLVIISRHFLENYTYDPELVEKKLEKITYNKIIKESNKHHIHHAYCGFYNSKFDRAICLSIDGSGAILSNDQMEIESIYYFDKNSNPKELYQRTREFKSIEENGRFWKYMYSIGEDEMSIGERFQKLSAEFGYDPIDGAGKIMGLGQYKNHKKKLQIPYHTEEWCDKVDSAYNLQQETQDKILSFIKKYTKETGVKNVVISGGYGLNCVANYHYIKNLKDINLYVDPVCFDAGISIGTAYFYYLNSDKNLPDIKPLENVYIGHSENEYNLYDLETQKVTYDDIVNLLLQQNIVALFQGKSEAGQRALGNRSLLFDPRVPNGKNIVNQIKKRENFRPFAGTILQEEAHKWFNMISLKESPYMQYAMDAYENAIEQVPAIIHADNTCRIQTVTQKQNKHFYNLIQSFSKKTGVPILLNTSFNLGGEPLVETFEHAINTLRKSQIEYLYLPEIETLVTIKNKKLLYS